MNVEAEQIDVKEPELLWGDPVLTPKGEFAIADRVGFTWATVHLLDGTEERHKIPELTRLVGKLPPSELPIPDDCPFKKGDRVHGFFQDGDLEGRVCGVIGGYCLVINDEGFLIGSLDMDEIADQANPPGPLAEVLADIRAGLETAADPLARLASEINQAHADYEEAESTALNASQSAIQSALIAGEKLCLAKEQVPHGEWLPWLGKSCPKLSERNAQRYMRVYRNRDQLKSDTRDGFSLRQALEVLATPREEAIEPAPEATPRPEVPEAPAASDRGDRPKPVPTLEEMKNLFSQLGTIEHWKGAKGFVVRNEKIGVPFPLAFPSAAAAWSYWNERQEGIQRLLSRLQAEVQPSVSQPSTSCLTCQHHAAGLESDYFCHARNLQLVKGEDLGGDCQLWKRQVTIEDVLLHEAMQPQASPETEPVAEPSTRKERIEGDKYYSPDGLIQALLDQVEISGEVLDPCAGDGSMAEVITNETGTAWAYTADLDPGPSIDYNRRFDAAVRSNWELMIEELFEGDNLEWVITNPPFALAHQILPLAWEFSSIGVAFLLRLSWLEPCGNRADWMKEHSDHLTNVIIFNPRPQFREDTSGGDQVTVAWFVWRKNFSWQKQGLPCPFTFITDWRNP